MFITAFPPQTYHCRYVDLAKSKPWLDENGILQNKESLAFWTPTQEYITDVEMFEDLVKDIDTNQSNVVSPGLGVIARFKVEKGTKGSVDGIIQLEYNEKLMAYRWRADGLIGLETLFGDTRLSDGESLRFPGVFPASVVATTHSQAHWNEPQSIFTLQ